MKNNISVLEMGRIEEKRECDFKTAEKIVKRFQKDKNLEQETFWGKHKSEKVLTVLLDKQGNWDFKKY